MRTLFIFAVLLVLFGAIASPAFAGEAGANEDPLGLEDMLDYKTILVSIVVFGLLLIVLSKTAWRPILDGLQQREATIKKALDDAEAAHAKAKALIAEYEGKIDGAREESQAIFDEARRDAGDISAQIEEDARTRADETVERAKREINQLTTKAWDGLVRDAAALATEAAGKIIEQELSADGHAALVAGVVSKFSESRGAGSRAAPTVPPVEGEDA